MKLLHQYLFRLIQKFWRNSPSLCGKPSKTFNFRVIDILHLKRREWHVVP